MASFKFAGYQTGYIIWSKHICDVMTSCKCYYYSQRKRAGNCHRIETLFAMFNLFVSLRCLAIGNVNPLEKNKKDFTRYLEIWVSRVYLVTSLKPIHTNLLCRLNELPNKKLEVGNNETVMKNFLSSRLCYHSSVHICNRNSYCPWVYLAFDVWGTLKKWSHSFHNNFDMVCKDVYQT